jgi:LacI family transcriptional regulator
MRPRITILDIAREVGVTAATVSNVLNGRNLENRPSSKKRAEQIREVADRLGYRPNLAARSMRAPIGKSLALLTSAKPDLSGYFAPTLLTGAAAAAAEQGCRLVFASWPDEELTDPRHMSRLMMELGVDGVLLNYIIQAPAELEELLQRYDIPAVWVNTKRPRDCVHPDDVAGGRAMAEHLLELGHRRIAYVHLGIGAHYSTVDRAQGFATAMTTAGREPWCEVHDRISSEPDQMAFLTALLSRPDRPTALALYGSQHPVHVFYAAARLGLRIPEDLSVVSMWDVGSTCSPGLPLTRWTVAADQVGAEAVRRLLSGAGGRAAPLAIPPVYGPGRTSGPLRTP